MVTNLSRSRLASDLHILNWNNEDTDEDLYWLTANPDELWVMDKLILSRKMGYKCGPVGLDVPKPDYYIVRPCVNMIGLGLGASIEWIDRETMHLPVGHFWCEVFTGPHLSVDYHYGKSCLVVQGFKDEDTLTRWNKWVRFDAEVSLPKILEPFKDKEYINCEFIGGNLIEVHFRSNPDFKNDIQEFIPVWEGEDINPPKGYRYIEDPEVHGRIGAFVK